VYLLISEFRKLRALELAMKSNSLKILFFCLLSLQSTAQFKLYQKGHDSYAAGKYQDAISNFSQYLSKPTRDKSLDVEVFYLRALSYYKANDFKNAIADFEETVLLDHNNKGNIYWFMAKGYEHLGNTTEAISSYTNALRELSGNNDAKSKLFAERGMLHAKQGDGPLAYNDLKLAHTLNPSGRGSKA
jgi:tetratricopeptide (TPR) repeat protein